IPYFTERADITHDRHREWSHCDFEGKLPSEVFREHNVTCFIDEPYGMRNIDAIGEEMVCWECDYPHADTTWPEAPEFLWRSLTGLSDKIIDKVTHQNAMRLYNFDAFAHRTRAESTVAALRALAMHVDTRPSENVSGAKPGDT